MIVVVIVGLLASAIAPMVSRNTDDLLREQADRFVALVNLSRDEAILQSRQLGLVLQEDAYAFVQQDGENWVPFEEGPFRKRSLSSGSKASLYLDAVDVAFQQDVDGEAKLRPQVYLLSSGEMTPFSYEFELSTGTRIKVSYDAIGNVDKVVTASE